MNRQLHALFLSCMLCLTASAQSKLDLHSRFMLLQQQKNLPTLSKETGTGKVVNKTDETNGGIVANRVRRVLPLRNQQHSMGMIRLAEGSTSADLQEEGIDVLRQRGRIAIVSMLTDDVERIATLKCVDKVQLARPVMQKMNTVRNVVGIDKIHSGEGLPQAYTGKGVVCGTVDQGIEPNNINFQNASGKTRFGYISRIYASDASSKGYVYENYYPRGEADLLSGDLVIESMKTDDNTTYHGTHTMNIMAGGYKGNITASHIDEVTGLGYVTESEPNPYYGIATDAELVASCGDLYDSFIAYGIDDILNYATYSADPSGSKKKPVVVNLSLGSNAASHDPASLMNQFLDECGKVGILCLSSGNEGNIPLALRKTFTAEDTKVQSFIKPETEVVYTTDGTAYPNLRYGEFVAYSNDSSEFTLQVVVYNKKRGSIAARATIPGNTNGSYVGVCSSSSYQVADGVNINSTFAKAFDGYVVFGSMIDSEVGRYYVDVNIWVSDNQTTNADGNYLLGVIIEGKDGQHIECYGDGQYCYFDGMDIDGWQNGSCDGTISDLACAHNVISVGSYNLNTDWASLDGSVMGYGSDLYPTGEVTSFSSYGTLADGRQLPDVCAPGMAIISAANAYCIENTDMGYSDKDLQGILKTDNRSYYWHQSAGTSMAVPVVSGSVALWLEADSTLTVNDVRDIIHTTAVRDSGVEKGNQVQWGAGKFDAYAGLKEVLRRKTTGISRLSSDDNRLLLQPLSSGRYQAFVAGASRLNITVSNLQGQQLQHYTANGEEATIDCTPLPHGIYVITVNGKSQKISKK